MTTESDTFTSTRHVRLYAGIALFALLVLGIVLVPMSEREGQAGATADADKPPMPRTEVEFTENKLIEQKAVDLDATLKLSTAHGEVASAIEK